MIDLADLHISRTVTVPVDATKAYELVSDVTRMGEWSPVCKVCTWDEGAGASAGSWFTGKNIAGEREWETRCEVVAAAPGEEIAWIVGGRDDGTTRWGYRFSPVEGGTEIEESWQIVRLHERMAEMTDEQVDKMKERTRTSIEGTLANLGVAMGAGA
ncbi:MAG TPA: SRPBCC family protein [Acidimicrobiales bacterium]|jgi:hypothetical protein